MGCIICVIKSFKHKGIEDFFRTGNKKSIIPEMDLPGYQLHSLLGKEKGRWAVSVNGNWRITFEFINQDAILVDYEDYH